MATNVSSPTLPSVACVGVTPLSKAPLLGWDSFWPPGDSDLPSIGDLPHKAFTSSGRAALHAALLQMVLPAGSRVLVPTYHCPTMVAPVVEAGLTPVFYPLDAVGLPALERIEGVDRVRAMFVAHYFGLAQSLDAVQAWCRERGIVLVEDCAHSYFGLAGDRPVGQWGDYAIASVSKFFPVPEAGVLASATRVLKPLELRYPGWREQVRAVWSVLDRAREHQRLTGLTHAMLPVYALRHLHKRGETARRDEHDAVPDAAAIRAGCDMGRIREAPGLISRWLHGTLPQRRIVDLRRANYEAFVASLDHAPGARALLPDLRSSSAPYVLPFWVDGRARADAVYARLRAERLPVFRWDRLWPGTPTIEGDTGALWSRHVMQLLCHQDLSLADVAAVVARIRAALAAS